ncbi:molybdopterin-binding oxidoreductase, partial [Streptomyces atroolivaceus]
MIAGFTALCVAGLVAAAVRPEAGPVTAVGGAVIDRTPAAVKDFAVRNFGTDDKLVLRLGILVLLAAFAMAVGCLALRHRWGGAAAVLVFGVVGAVAAGGGEGGSPAHTIPSFLCALFPPRVSSLLPRQPAPTTPPPP